MDEERAFYDKWVEKSIRDYLIGNNRIESAINFTKNIIVNSNKEVFKVLDIGCSIGWSSYEIAKQFPGAEVHGIDLSPKCIEAGKKLFAATNLILEVKNVLEKDVFSNVDSFDFIILLDVYEHIPAKDRAYFNDCLEKLLTKDGTIIFTIPSPHYQSWLMQNFKEGLQPVDEIIGLSEINQLTKQTNSYLTCLKYEDNAMKYDYIHFSCSKGIACEPIDYKRNYSLSFDSLKIRNARILESPYKSIAEDLNKEIQNTRKKLSLRDRFYLLRKNIKND